MTFIQRNGDTVALRAGGTIYNHRILAFGSSDDVVVQASASTDLFMGVSYLPNAHEDPVRIGQAIPTPSLDAGDTVDMVINGYPQVEYGGTVARGTAVTSDADGKAVAAAAGDQILGYAGFSAVDGDIGPVIIQRGVLGEANP